MNIIKSVIVISTLLLGATVFAAEPKAEVIEHCSHDIIKLVKQNKLPQEALTHLHMIRVVEVVDGYQVVAVLDHNENHDQTPANIKFKYDLNAKMTSFEYREGYINPNPSAFNKIFSAKLFDYAAEILLESKDATLNQYADTVVMIHLIFDAEKNAAVFEMVDSNNKELNVWMSLDGKLLETKFLN